MVNPRSGGDSIIVLVSNTVLYGTQGPKPGHAITFSLAPRLMVSGSVAVVLHLYRDKQLALTSTLTVCKPEALKSVLLMCRLYLGQLGIENEIPVRSANLRTRPEPLATVPLDHRQRSLRLPPVANL